MGEAGKAELLRIADYLGQAVKTGDGVRRCAEGAGSRCPIRPIYNKRTFELSVCGVVAVQLTKLCDQQGSWKPCNRGLAPERQESARPPRGNRCGKRAQRYCP